MTSPGLREALYYSGLWIHDVWVYWFTGLWVYGTMGSLVHGWFYGFTDLCIHGFTDSSRCIRARVAISHDVAAEGGRPRVYANPLIRISAEVPHAVKGSKSPGLREALNFI